MPKYGIVTQNGTMQAFTYDDLAHASQVARNLYSAGAKVVELTEVPCPRDYVVVTQRIFDDEDGTYITTSGPIDLPTAHAEMEHHSERNPRLFKLTPVDVFDSAIEVKRYPADPGSDILEPGRSRHHPDYK